MNATQAAIRAGYSEKTAKSIGQENLTKPDVSAYLQTIMQERAVRTKIDADWVLISAKRVFDRCMQDEPVIDRNGDPVFCKTESGDLAAAYKFDPAGANKALETIGKHVNVNAFAANKINLVLSDDFDEVINSDE